MNLSGLLSFVHAVPTYQQLAGAAEHDALEALVDARRGEGLGILSAARPYVVAALYRQLDRPLLILTSRSERVGQWVEQLRTWTGADVIYPFPEPDALPYERVSWSHETVSDRLTALTVLTRPPERGAPIVVASARAIMQRTTPVREFRLGVRQYRVGQEIDLQRTLEGWVAHGYRPDTVVEEPGTFNRRGGLVDVYPPNLLRPVRIELFGDEIDSLRLFDPTTQRTIDTIDEFVLAPATEALPRLASAAAERVSALDLTYCHGPARTEYQQDLAHLEMGTTFRGIAFYLPFFYSFPATLLDYLPANGLCLVDDWDGLMAATVDLDRQAQALQEDLVKAGELPRNFPRPYFNWEEIRDHLNARHCVVLGGRMQEGHPGLLTETFQHGEGYGGQLKRVLDGFQEMRDAGERVVVVSRQARRIAELLEERHTTAMPVEEVTEPPAPGSLTLVHGTLAEGWVLQAPSLRHASLRLFTDSEIFGWARPAPRRARHPRPVASEVFFADMQPGSYVVHIEHGIGMFQGLVKMGVDTAEREYLLVEYAAGDKLYVPVYQADRLSRYVGVSDHEPRINRLGTTEWEQIKERTQKAVEEIADDLLLLYAAREVVEGHPFAPDTLWQAELEASFPYVETDAQVRAL